MRTTLVASGVIAFLSFDCACFDPILDPISSCDHKVSSAAREADDVVHCPAWEERLGAGVRGISCSATDAQLDVPDAAAFWAADHARAAGWTVTLAAPEVLLLQRGEQGIVCNTGFHTPAPGHVAVFCTGG